MSLDLQTESPAITAGVAGPGRTILLRAGVASECREQKAVSTTVKANCFHTQSYLLGKQAARLEPCRDGLSHAFKRQELLEFLPHGPNARLG